VPDRTGYKGTRKSIAQTRREHRERVWRDADVPPAWEDKGADKELMREMMLSAVVHKGFGLGPS